ARRHDRRARPRRGGGGLPAQPRRPRPLRPRRARPGLRARPAGAGPGGAMTEDANDSLLAELARQLVVPGAVEAWPDRHTVAAPQRYRLDGLLGEGGTARVYRAFDTVLGRAVALKLLRDPAPETAQRFAREARAQARVQHEHVCPIYEVGELDGQ